jgi:hypothetical protein
MTSVKTKLFLLYNDEDISEYSHPDIIPLKLNQTPYFESEAFRMLEDLPNAENIGFLTPSAKDKIKDFSIEKTLNLNPRPIVYLYPSLINFIEKKTLEYIGEQFLIIWKYILDKHSIDHSVMNTYSGGYCNLWIAKKEFVCEYIEFARKTMEFLDNSPQEIRTLLFSDSTYHGKLSNTGILNKKFGFNYYPFHPFVMERLISLFAKIKNQPYKVEENIVGYIHVCQKGDWKRSFNILIDSVKTSKLYDQVKIIRIGIVNDLGYIINDPIFNDTKFETFYFGISSQYERPTLLHMRKMSEEDPETTVYFYLHTKGIRWYGTKHEPKVLEWIQSMLDCNITNWKNVINILGEKETYGCNYNGIHYSGNFWWATSKHIQKLSDVIPEYYTAPEDWVLTNKDNMYCYKNCGDDFVVPYDPEMY